LLHARLALCTVHPRGGFSVSTHRASSSSCYQKTKQAASRLIERRAALSINKRVARRGDPGQFFHIVSTHRASSSSCYLQDLRHHLPQGRVSTHRASSSSCYNLRAGGSSMECCVSTHRASSSSCYTMWAAFWAETSPSRLIERRAALATSCIFASASGSLLSRLIERRAALATDVSLFVVVVDLDHMSRLIERRAALATQ
jgi:hypothetical protein